MTDVNRNTIAWAEIKADVYCGENCDQHEPFIEVYCDGDMQSSRIDKIRMDEHTWPIGTKILIQVPACPGENCHADASFQDKDKKCTECGFNWHKWQQDKYS